MRGIVKVVEKATGFFNNLLEQQLDAHPGKTQKVTVTGNQAGIVFQGQGRQMGVRYQIPAGTKD